jgi:hypothetical protein
VRRVLVENTWQDLEEKEDEKRKMLPFLDLSK